MASKPPNRPLRDVLAGPDDGDGPVEWLTGVVVTRQITTPPYTVTVRLADGTVTEPLNYLGWWAPTVNDVCHLIRRGPALFVLGGVAPANLYVPPAPIVPPAPPAPPPAPPTVRTVNIGPTDQAYWDPTYAVWKGDDLIQGGPNRRPFWFYGGQIQAAKGAGTILSGTIYIARVSGTHGVNGAANVRLGTHSNNTRPGSGGTPMVAVEVAAQLARGQAAAVALTAGHLAQLNAGAAGLGLEPGSSSYSSPDYLRAVIGGASGQLSLTIQS